MKKVAPLIFLGVFTLFVKAQDYNQLIAEGTHTVESIVENAERYFDTVGKVRGTGYKPYKRWQYFAERAMDENGMLKTPKFYYNELERFNASINNEGLASRTVVGTWEEMGPTYWSASTSWNPGVGRITSVAIDETNLNHIIVGANTGGVWRSVDGGTSWTVLTDNLANIDVYALAIDPIDSDTYFWGSTSGALFKSTDAGATWTLHSNLPGGTINKILIDPTNTQKMYVSDQGVGLFKSTDGGATWTLINVESTTGYDFEFKPGDTNTIYASGNSFFTSTDGGLTFTTTNGLAAWSQDNVTGNTSWTTTGSNQNNSVTPKTGNEMAFLYVANLTSPVTRLVSPSLNISNAVNPRLDFSYTQVNWEGDQDELKVLYKTSANGTWVELANYDMEVTTWTDISLALPNASADYYIAFEGTANYGRGITIDDVFVNTDNLGAVFFDGFESAPNQFGSGPKMIGVSADDPSVVYVLESASGIFDGFHKSTDNGVNFSKLNHVGKNYFGYATNADDDLGQAPRDMDVVVNPNDVDDVHIAGINTWRSTNGGGTFSISSQWVPNSANGLNIGYCHADVDIMLFAGTGANAKLYVGSDGGLYTANNPTIVNSNYYTDLTPGLGIRQFYKIGVSQTNPVIVSGGSQDNGTSFLAADGTWTDWLGADGMESFIDKNNSQIMYGTSQFGSLYKTIDGASTLTGISQPDGKGGQTNWNWIVPFEQDPIVQNTIYVAFDFVYKSVDGGAVWTPISQDFQNNIDHLKIDPTNSNKMYLAINGDFWYTTSGGALWWQSSLDLNGGSINQIAVHPTDTNKIAIATTDNQKVYVSTNGGISFTSILWDLPNFSSQALAWQNNGEDGLYVGMNYGVYYTDNTLGNTWVPFNNGLPNVRINELEINSADNKLYAATFGRGLWRSNVYNPALSIDDFEFNDLTMYPNPAKNEVHLKWNKSQDVSIRIFDTQGKIMFYGKKVNLFNEFKVDVSAFNAGIYFVKLNSTNGEITKKLILK